MKRRLIWIISIGLLLILSFISVFLYQHKKNELKELAIKQQKQQEIFLLKKIEKSYNKTVITNKNTFLYQYKQNKYIKVGSITKDIELELEDLTKFKDEYFKLRNLNYYINYKDITKIDGLTKIEDTYKNYIPFNENIVTNNNTKLYINTSNYYKLNESLSLPIIIKEEDKYFVEYDNKLVYVLKNEVSTIENNNSDKEVAIDFSVLAYHYTISFEENEDKECTQAICMRDTVFDKHMEYIKEQNFYTATIKDVELFLDNKIRLPKKTVVITIDDGWYVTRSIKILEKYKLHASLFLIGSLAPVTAYQSDYLEINSHTWDLHKLGVCDTLRGSPITCINKDKILQDLKKSRESLNNSPYFCWPFYEYNDYAINLVKEAGFKLAFAGGSHKLNKNSNKYKLPRYGISKNTTVEELAKIVN